MSRATLTDVARAAGVSRATVSYALNHHRKISVATRERVCALADSMGYRPDTTLARQMARIRLGERIREPETIALVWPEDIRGDIGVSHFSESLRAGAYRRADELGYRLDEFHLQGESGMGVERLGSLLKARGIRGVLQGPVLKHPRARLRLDWSSLAGVSIQDLKQPPLPRVFHNHYEGMALCLRELHRQGFRRPALVIGTLVNERSQRAWVGSFLTHHPARRESGGLVRITPRSQPVGPSATAWLRRVRADVVIVEYAGFATGIDLPAATLNWHPRYDQRPGVDQRYEAIASAAVDFLVGQLAHNIIGLPELPVSISVPPVWRAAREVVA
jgi:LacI family transcriptional regulator